MTLTLIFITLHAFIRWTVSTNFDIIIYNNFWKIHCFIFSHTKALRDQIWRSRKIGHGQPRIIIWINLVVLEYPMLHTNSQGHRSFGSRGEMFSPNIWAWRPIWSCDIDHLNKLSFPHPMQVPHELWLQSAQRFRRKRSLKMLNLSDLDTRSINHLDFWYSYRFMYSFS